jgi:hypothetical protein
MRVKMADLMLRSSSPASLANKSMTSQPTECTNAAPAVYPWRRIISLAQLGPALPGKHRVRSCFGSQVAVPPRSCRRGLRNLRKVQIRSAWPAAFGAGQRTEAAIGQDENLDRVRAWGIPTISCQSGRDLPRAFKMAIGTSMCMCTQ